MSKNIIMALINAILSLIDSDLVRGIVRDILGSLPTYWWTAPASSSGKYHPAFALGEGGLVRHSVAVAFVTNELCVMKNITGLDRDILIAAALVHDGMKQGASNEGGHTLHEHPILMAGFLYNFGQGSQPCTEICERMGHLVASHMGRWTTSKYSSIVLPEPQGLGEILHEADYTCSRKWFSFEGIMDALLNVEDLLPF